MTTETRQHIHEEVFSVSPERLFAILHTPSAIRRWWSAARVVVLPEPGGTWAAAWGDEEDDPDYISVAKIRHFERPRRMVLADYNYLSRSGELSFDASFVVEFLVLSHPEGAVLRVTQDGFPVTTDADDFLKGCVIGWRETFAGIRKYFEDAGA